MPQLPYYHEDLEPEAMNHATELLENDGRVYRAQLKRKQDCSAREETKRRRKLPKPALGNEENGERKCYVYILHSVVNEGKTYVGWTKDTERRLEQHLGNLEGGAQATKNTVWKRACYATLPNEKTARTVEHKVKKMGESRKQRVQYLERTCKDNNWEFVAL